LRGIISESVKQVLGQIQEKTNKFPLTWKSKEDMTRYRDTLYPHNWDAAPGRVYVDDKGHVCYYDGDYNEPSYSYPNKGHIQGDLTDEPFTPIEYHCFDDGYDYCGDDDYNQAMADRNYSNRHQLATKGGQMAYDWDIIKHRYPQVTKHDKDDMDKRNSLRNFKTNGWSKYQLRATENMKNDWINHTDRFSHDAYGKDINDSNEIIDDHGKDIAYGNYDY
jgi:hypothetical protein